MFVIKRFDDENLVEHFKLNMITHTCELKFNFRNKKIGLYSKIYKNLINIKNVSEEEDRGGPIFMHFYGIIFKNKYLFGIICPQIWYTLFTFGIWFINDEYFYFKIISLIVWIYICVSNMDSSNYIRDKLNKWMKD